MSRSRGTTVSETSKAKTFLRRGQGKNLASQRLKEMGLRVQPVSMDPNARYGMAALHQGGPGGMMQALKQFGPAPGAKKMLEWEKAAAEWSLRSGVYVGWRGKNSSECTRIGPDSLCFCGHLFGNHNMNLTKNQYGCKACPCRRFEYIPSRPEECGEWWLPRRKGFDVREYTAKCKCKHSHLEHDCSKFHCKVCGCGRFRSAFLCVVCEGHSEDHETIWETEKERRTAGRSTGGSYLPLADTPGIAELVFSNKGRDRVDATRGWAPKQTSFNTVQILGNPNDPLQRPVPYAPEASQHNYALGDHAGKSSATRRLHVPKANGQGLIRESPSARGSPPIHDFNGKLYIPQSPGASGSVNLYEKNPVSSSSYFNSSILQQRLPQQGYFVQSAAAHNNLRRTPRRALSAQRATPRRARPEGQG